MNSRTRPYLAAAVLASILLAAGCMAPEPEAVSATPMPQAAPASTLAQTPGPEADSWDRELPPEVDLEGSADRHPWTLLRAVDASTGAPVVGALVRECVEPDFPHAEPWTYAVTATSDRDGWLLLAPPSGWPWWYVEAPGYATLATGFGEVPHLRRGIDVPIQVRDRLDRPMAGAFVEICLGCGHTPPAASAVSGIDGRLVLRNVDPHDGGTLWIRSAGLQGSGPDLFTLPVEDGARVLRGLPGPVVEGRILLPDGGPAAGALVGTRNRDRGPWTVAGADGRFRLLGAAPHERLVAYSALPDSYPEGKGPATARFWAVPGISPVVRLHEPTEDEIEKAQNRFADVEPRMDRDAKRARATLPNLRVLVRGPGTPPAEGTRVWLLREDRAEGTEGQAVLCGDGLEAVFGVEAGTWKVTAGEPAGQLRPASKTVVVGKDGAEVTFDLLQNPTWSPTVQNPDSSPVALEGEGGRATFSVITPDGKEPAVAAPGGRGIFVPAEGPFVVECTVGSRSARLLLDGPPSESGPAFILPPNASETSLPEPSPFPSSRLEVFLPDGSPNAGALVTVSHEGDPAWVDTRSWSLDDFGACETSFLPGDRIRVTPELPEGEWNVRLEPLVETIRGPGPWMFRWPAAKGEGPGPWFLRWTGTSVEVRAEDEVGKALEDFEVLVPEGLSVSVGASDGVVRLLGSPAGPLRFWVYAEDRRVHDVRLVLKEGQHRNVTVRLRPK